MWQRTGPVVMVAHCLPCRPIPSASKEGVSAFLHPLLTALWLATPGHSCECCTPNHMPGAQRGSVE